MTNFSVQIRNLLPLEKLESLYFSYRNVIKVSVLVLINFSATNNNKLKKEIYQFPKKGMKHKVVHLVAKILQKHHSLKFPLLTISLSTAKKYSRS